MPALTESHVKDVCRPGTGTETCRYLLLGAGGWVCGKHTVLAVTLDDRVREGTIVARGDNCAGMIDDLGSVEGHAADTGSSERPRE